MKQAGLKQERFIFQRIIEAVLFGKLKMKFDLQMTCLVANNLRVGINKLHNKIQ